MKRGAQRSAVFSCVAAIVLAFNDVSASDGKTGPPSTRNAIAIENVTILPMSAGAAPVLDATVIVEAGRIETIGPSGATMVPPGMRRVDGTDKWLMPALSDMHVHVENARMAEAGTCPEAFDTADILLPYVANGVLQVFNLSAMSESVGQRNEVESGRVLGPHMALAAMLDGSPAVRPGRARSAGTPSDGRQAVRDIKVEGYEFVKTYERLDLPTFSAILDQAKLENLRVLGHIPARGEGITEKFFQPGFEIVVHAEEYAYQSEQAGADPKAMSDDDIPRFAEMAKRNGTWLISTLSLNERIVEQTRSVQSLEARPEMAFVHPMIYKEWIENNRYAKLASPERLVRLERVVDFNRKVVQVFLQAGVPILPGTDSLIPGVVAGFALHDELEAMTRAGMTNADVLTAATRLSAEWLGVAEDRGTVEQGKRADLILLDGDPMSEIGNTRRISAVIAGGRYLARETLDDMMEELAARYAAMPGCGGVADVSGAHDDP